jgi:hypothetical protein
VKPGLVPLFFPILQRGFTVGIRTGCSVRALLSDQFGLSGEIIEGRIQTVFLDGKPVDDIDASIVQGGSILALSSAMPGLLGASLRRGGYYARMRSQISHVEKGEPSRRVDGRIVVKLFNLTIRELGPLFLERGIWLDGEEAGDLFKNRIRDVSEGCVQARVDDRIADPTEILSLDFSAGGVFLQVRPA